MSRKKSSKVKYLVFGSLKKTGQLFSPRDPPGDSEYNQKDPKLLMDETRVVIT